jgi:phospholipid N-methyltransferase
MSLQPPPSRLSDVWLFFSKFCRQGTRVGSVVPSSGQFARRMLTGIDWRVARCVVELGAGTGAVTAEMLRQAGATCRCVIIERDADFCRRLGERFPAAEIVHADACNLESLLRDRGIDRVDHILCGLALPWFNEENRHRVLDSSRRVLGASGSFRQMTYMPWVHYGTYHRYFHSVGFRWVFLNVPPGGFYLCEKPREGTSPA